MKNKNNDCVEPDVRTVKGPHIHYIASIVPINSIIYLKKHYQK